MTTLARLSEIHANEAPDRVAVVFADRQCTWEAFHSFVLRCVAGLRAAGICQGDCVAYFGLNSDRYIILLQACYRMGAVLLPINARWVSREVDYVLLHSRCKMLVTEEEFLPVINSLSDLVRPRSVVLSDGAARRLPSLSDWLTDYPCDPDDAVEDPNSLALLLYTSGTTGNPKGVLLTHNNLLSGFKDSVCTGESWGHWTYDTTMLLAAPVFHIGGTNMTTQALAGGGKTVVLSRADIPTMLAAVAEHRVTKMFAVPSMLNMMLSDPTIDKVNLSSMRHLLYGASSIPLDVLRRSMGKFPNADFVQLYGMTETSGVATWLPAADHLPQGAPRMASCGKPYKGTEIRIVGRNGETRGIREVGEVVIKSASLMAGYLNDPEATSAALRGGWYHTGDAGYLDEDAYLYIQGRLKDMIISGGENVYPVEVEQALAEHLAVLDCAVIGVPDERWGEAVKAVVVLGPAHTATAEELQEFLRDRIAGYKIPKTVDFVLVLPRTSTGKILKRELRAPFWRGRARAVG
jgi:acyl-CoA synthetase (AMP-forming)/AMP-acid ligase II